MEKLQQFKLLDGCIFLSTIGNKSSENERRWEVMSEIVATVTITLATLISMTIIGVYAIKTMTKIANKDNDK